MGSDDKLKEVYAQYEIPLMPAYRFGGAIFFEADIGLLILKQRKISENRVIFEEDLKKAMSDKGFMNLDFCIKNKDNKYVSEGYYGETYTLRRWYAGSECDLTNPSNCVNAAAVLGRMHHCMTGYIPSPKNNSRGSEELPAEGTLLFKEYQEQSNESTYHVEKAASTEVLSAEYKYDEGESALSDFYTAHKNGTANISKLSTTYEGVVTGISGSEIPYVHPLIKEILVKRLSEMKRILTYLKKQKQPGAFESFLIKQLPVYISKGTKAVSILNSSFDKSLHDDAVMHGSFFHGSYTGHNIFNDGKNTSVVNFDKAKIGPKVLDVYHFIRKLGEKNAWDEDLLFTCLNEYLGENELDERESNILTALLHFPEKFWKTVNMYFNSKKNQILGKAQEKTDAICEMHDKKELFEERLINYLS